MINYDIPWSPVRLEQRVGRIHRYGQERDCLIINFVSQSTREGRVLQRLLDRLAEIRKELGTDQVFDVVGEVFPSNRLEQLIRDMYARKTDEHEIQDRIVKDVSPDRFRAITESTLEGLAKKELNLSSILGKSAEAKERRLVPEVIEQFFAGAAPESGLQPKETAKQSHVYRVGRVPRNLIVIGDSQEEKFGRLGRDYGKVVFDKAYLKHDPTLEWVTPGHPLFETVRTDILRRTADHLHRGAVFFDLHAKEASQFDVFAASIRDGRGHTLHRRLFLVTTNAVGTQSVREPTYLHDLTASDAQTDSLSDVRQLASRQAAEQFLYEQSLQAWIETAAAERQREVGRIAEHVKISLNALIDKQQRQLGELLNRQIQGQTVTGLDGQIAQSESHLEDLQNRLDTRLKELELERHCSIADIKHLGRGWVVPHPAREQPNLLPMVRDDEIERIAVAEAIRFEESRGWIVESVESSNRGFDLISRRPHPEDAKTFIEVRFIEVKGRAGVGIVALSENEYRTAERLKGDYWLYAVFNCSGTPELHTVQNPIRLGWQPVVSVEHYRIEGGRLKDEG
jgi:hypothetical protein